MTERFLRTIVEEIRASPKGTVSESVEPSGPPPSLRRAVLEAPNRKGLVVEYKRASPGRPDPRLPRRSIAEFVAATEVDSVVGYSCLATVPRFDGSPELVAELARSTSRPVLYKDFVLGRSQLDAAGRTGAAAALLIARLEGERLLDAPLHELAARAHDLQLEVLLELHAPDEVDFARRVEPELVGVNVRDLDTLRLERERARSTLTRLSEQGFDRVVGLSGVEEPVDAEFFWRSGCRAVVVGSAVALASDPAAFLRSLVKGGDAP